jgi:hypothetical protein
MTQTIEQEVDRATELGRRLESLVVIRKEFLINSDREYILSGYWSLVFELYKGILCLLKHDYYAPAFALLRPVVDALVKSHIAHIGPDDEVRRISLDQWSLNYEKDGTRIDKAMRAERPVMEDYLKKARDLLHSFTHSGMTQLARRFEGTQVGQSFTEIEIVALIRNCTSAVFMVTVLVTQHFGFVEENRAAQRIWIDYGSSISPLHSPC